MKCGSAAMRPNSAGQLLRVSVITPRLLVPALSSSWAIAFSSTPVMRNENPDQVIGSGWCSSPTDDHAARIAPQLTHRHTVDLEFVVFSGWHHRIRLIGPNPLLAPLVETVYRLRRLARDAHRQLVCMVDRHHRVAEIIRQRLIVHPDCIKR